MDLPGSRQRGGRKIGPPVDNGTVALAMAGMAFYWLMPLAAAGRARPKKRKAQAAPATTTAAPATDIDPAAEPGA